jgi:hypothetical protein
MAIFRSQIETALDEFVVHEGGMKFQALAVLLGKMRHPDLVACEKKADFGVDAYVSRIAAHRSVGKALACSITPTYEKVSGDAKKAKEQYADIDLFVFVTTGKVGNPKKEEWRKDLAKDCGYELEVLSREELIAQLMLPSNAPLLEQFLGLTVERTQDEQQTLENMRAAAGAVAESWVRGLREPNLVNLRSVPLDARGHDAGGLWGHAEILGALASGRRLVLSAPAGAGKTTTMIQLAASIAEDPTRVPLLIDLPAWVSRRTDILTFVAGSPEFQARAIDAPHLARAHEGAHIDFLLNGWNEVSETDALQADAMLRSLEREFPKAGIIVATRPHHFSPQLLGATFLRLQQLTRRDRREYLKGRLGDRAATLSALLDGDPVLDELTRTPFILSRVASLFSAGLDIPRTKVRVLDEVVRLHEGSDAHRAHLLQAPIAGAQSEYLGPLAIEMTQRGVTAIGMQDAYATTTAASRARLAAGQIAAIPDPGTVVNILTGHHLLEPIAYPTGFRFQHHQFQEYYATKQLRTALQRALTGSPDDRRGFAATYLNDPAWGEPLRMLAQDLGADLGSAQEGESRPLLEALIVLTQSVSLIFAAELAGLAGATLWSTIGPQLAERLRRWQAIDDAHHRQCALAAMLATRSPDFADILLPLLSSADQQQRLSTSRLWSETRPTSLGADWQAEMRRWPEAARTEFISELLYQGYSGELVGVVKTDPSIVVKTGAINTLLWNGVEDAAVELIESLAQREADEVLGSLETSIIPAALQARALTIVQERFEATEDAVGRMRIALRLRELGANVEEGLKAALGTLSAEQLRQDERLIYSAIELVAANDSAWASEWVARTMVAGSLWPRDWKRFLVEVPKDLIEATFDDIQATEYHSLERKIAVLSTNASPPVILRVFERIREIRAAIAVSPFERHEVERRAESNLSAVFRAFDAEQAVAAILPRIENSTDEIDLETVADLFSTAARSDEDRLPVTQDLRERLRAYFVANIATGMRAEDATGQLKVTFASCLAQLGGAHSINDLEALARAEHDRYQAIHALRVAGDHSDRVQFGMTSHSHWHARAIASIGGATAQAALLKMFEWPDEERAVGEVWKLQGRPNDVGVLPNRKDYGKIWDSRRARQADGGEGVRPPEAVALRNRITQLLVERAKAKETRSNDYRLPFLTSVLANVDPYGSSDLILELIAIPVDADGWSRVEAIDKMLSAGVVLPSDPTLSAIDAMLNRKYGIADNERWMVKQFLGLCPFVDDPVKGLAKIREVLGRKILSPHHLEELAQSVAHSQSNEALPLLQEMKPAFVRDGRLDSSWLQAIAAIRTAEGREVLLSFVDPQGQEQAATDFRDSLAFHLAEAARDSAEVRQRLIGFCSQGPKGLKRQVLGQAMGLIGTPEAMFAGLQLLDDADRWPIPDSVENYLEKAFVEHRPEGGQGVFALIARAANDLRLELCRLAKEDAGRCRAAFSLLGQIELWRLERGRPLGEPRNPILADTSDWPLGLAEQLTR